MELREAIRKNPMTGFQWGVVVICILLTIVDGYEILVTAFTLTRLTAEWDLSLSQQGLIASIGTLGMGAGAIFLSPLADRYGRRKHILASLVFIVIGMTLSAFAPSFGAFLVFRFFAGLFLGGIVPSINALVSEYASDDKRGTVMGIYGIGLPLGAALGGFLSIWLIRNWDWHGPFIFSAIVTAILTVVAYFKLPESVSYLVEKRPEGALEKYNHIATKIGLPTDNELPPPTAQELRPSMGKDMWQGVMAQRTLLLWVSYALLIASFYFANSFTAKLVKESTGNNDIGLTAQSLVAAGGVVGALLFAAASSRFHPRVVTAALLLFGTLSYGLFASAFTNTSMVLFLAVLVGLAANGGVAAFYAVSPPIYPTAIRSTAIGQMMGFGRIVAFLAPNFATFLLGRGMTPPQVYYLHGGLLALGGLCVIALHRSYRGANSMDAMELETRTMEKQDEQIAH